MIFSSPFFLYIFLPLLLLTYYICLKIIPKVSNIILLFFSLFFYSFGELNYLFIIIFCIIFNHLYGNLISIFKDKLNIKYAKLFLLFGCCINLVPLVYYKYSKFILDNLYFITELISFKNINLQETYLPLGISFFTFQAISYLIDIYRGSVKPEKSFINTALFISLFPQLVAGPIVRYKQINKQLYKRTHTYNNFSYGVYRFVIGLSKKVIIADNLGLFSDFAFSQSTNNITFTLAWLGAICFTLQIYFDFSAYSDMAIGLGRMFGFVIPENFNYPYIARNVRDLWNRWHISLTTWFRDYVYASLRSLPSGRKYKNFFSIFVFILVGFWHGASWNFILWGGFYGVLLVVERKGLLKIINKLPLVLQHLYLLLIVVFSIILFRANSIDQIYTFLKAMLGLNFDAELPTLFYINYNEEVFCLIIIGIIASTPIIPFLVEKIKANIENTESQILYKFKYATSVVSVLLIFIFLFVFTSGVLISSSQSPFVYFRF